MLRLVVSSTRSPSRRQPWAIAELVEFANNRPMLRAWEIGGTGGHGTGLSRDLREMSEIVIELDRPKRAARRNCAKSDRSMRSGPPVKAWLDRGSGLPLLGRTPSPVGALGYSPLTVAGCALAGEHGLTSGVTACHLELIVVRDAVGRSHRRSVERAEVCVVNLMDPRRGLSKTRGTTPCVSPS